jgi:quercetin dioxygenase-like cupin family protein
MGHPWPEHRTFPDNCRRYVSANDDNRRAHVSSLNRTIDGDALVQHLTQDQRTIDQELVAKHGRSARTLVKEGPLRLTLMAIGANGGLPEHSTEGPVSIHLLEGDVTFSAAGAEYPLVAGDVLVLAAGVRHAARSKSGALFLLTVVHLPSAGTPEA